MWKQVFAALSAVSFLLSFGGIVTDDMNGWRRLMNWLTRTLPDTCEFAGSCGRWLFFVFGSAFLALTLKDRLRTWLHRLFSVNDLLATDSSDTCRCLLRSPWIRLAIAEEQSGLLGELGWISCGRGSDSARVLRLKLQVV